MRRLLAFLLLILVFAAAVSGCGSKAEDPTEVVESWSKALNAGDDAAAAGLFADDATVIQGGQTVKLAGHDEALSFNASLPCGGEIVEQSLAGNEVTATFSLTERPGHTCDGTGHTAVAVFEIMDGKIVVWHQLPTPEPGAQSV